MQQTQRLNWIDTARGIGIILVVLGHAARHEMMEASALCGYLSFFIYSFHVPLLFVLSGITFGMTYQKYLQQPSSLFRARANTLLVPFGVYAVLIYLCFSVAYRIPITHDILDDTFRTPSPIRYVILSLLDENPYSAHLWYLWILFLMSALTFGILSLGKNSPKTHRLLLVLSLVLYGISTFSHLPLMLYKFVHLMVYFVLGIRLQRRPQLPRTHWALTGLCWLVLLINTPIVQHRVLDNHESIMILQKCILLAVVPTACVSILRLSQRIAAFRPLVWLGRNSHSIYLLHQPLCAFAGLLLYNRLRLPLWPVFFLCTAVSFAFPMLVLWFLGKCPPLARLAKKLLNLG